MASWLTMLHDRPRAISVLSSQ